MIAAIIVAAGSGHRLGGELPKQFQELAGAPMVARTVWAFARAGSVGRILVAVPSAYVAYARNEIFASVDWSVRPQVVEGGAERWQSVSRCLELLESPVEHVLVHDGARPLISPELIRRVCERVVDAGALVTAVREKNTLKSVSLDGRVTGTVDRGAIWAAQTPQAFSLELLKRAYAAARASGETPTDDSTLVERLGHPVLVLEGEEANFKVTTPFDLTLARLLVTAIDCGGTPC